MGYSQREWIRRYPRYVWNRIHAGKYPPWLRRLWHRRARARWKHEKPAAVADFDAYAGMPPKRAGNWWEWS